ncbi:Glycine betaine/L-proline transport ATP-binding protein ProV, partial [human gut metagenome]
ECQCRSPQNICVIKSYLAGIISLLRVIYRHKQIKESFYCMAIKLEIKNLYKIFGEHPQRAFKYIEQGLSKEQILEKTG